MYQSLWKLAIFHSNFKCLSDGLNEEKRIPLNNEYIFPIHVLQISKKPDSQQTTR